MGKRVVIVGAGYAGIYTALALSRKNKKLGLDITVIDRNEYHTLLTELHEVAANRIAEDGIIIPLERIFRTTDVNVIKDSITGFDFDKKTVKSETAVYPYDYLVLAGGSESNFFGIEGLKENAFTLWSFEDSLRIREHIRDCFQKASQCKDAKKRAALLRFVVVGAGATGSEMAGELVYYARDLARFYKIPYSEVDIRLVDMLDKVLPIFGGTNSAKAQKKMEKLGIKVMLKTGVKQVDEKGMTTDKEYIETKTVIWAAGIRANSDVENMDVEKGRGRRLTVDKFGRTKHKNVYAVGDISAHLDKDGNPYPAMVENAMHSGTSVAKNIIKDVQGQEPEPAKIAINGAMVCVGPFFAVSELMGKKLPVWLSIVMKYIVNAHYLWEIAGFAQVAKYFYHEFIEKQQRRHFFEKHWSTKIQAWWLLPLRLFLGVWWLYEGIVKVLDGWFKEPMLASFLGIASDGASGASAGAAYINRYDTIFRLNWRIFDFHLSTESRLVTGETISSQMAAQLKLFHFDDWDLVGWFCRVITMNDGVAMFFQVLVVIMEIAVGLMLVGGFLNFPASVLSTGLMVMFFTSTGIYQSSWWMLFASIAVMGGAGRAFGCDYYLIPWLNNVWEKLWKTHRLKLGFKGALKRWDGG